MGSAMDRISKTVRSRIMSRIRKVGNKSTERRFRAALTATGFRGWTMHARHILGCPDFVFATQRIAIFVDGCFWHGCKKCCRPPQSNLPYWKNKLRRNRERDRTVTRSLRKDKWRVIRFWEHHIRRDLRNAIRLVGSSLAVRAFRQHNNRNITAVRHDNKSQRQRRIDGRS
jgi:DNA mismatch endonuclease, patch repair protein